MDIEQQILVVHSKANTILVTDYVGNDRILLDEVMDLFFNGENKVSQRISNVVSLISDRDNSLLSIYLPQIISNLENNHQHISILAGGQE